MAFQIFHRTHEFWQFELFLSDSAKFHKNFASEHYLKIDFDLFYLSENSSGGRSFARVLIQLYAYFLVYQYKYFDNPDTVQLIYYRSKKERDQVVYCWLKISSSTFSNHLN